jgi:hypothetical protein
MARITTKGSFVPHSVLQRLETQLRSLCTKRR